MDEAQSNHSYVPLNNNEEAMPQASPSHVKAMIQKLQETGDDVMYVNAIQQPTYANEQNFDLVYESTEMLATGKEDAEVQTDEEYADVGEEYCDVIDDDEDAFKVAKPLLIERRADKKVVKNRTKVPADTSAIQVNLPLPPTTKKRQTGKDARQCLSW